MGFPPFFGVIFDLWSVRTQRVVVIMCTLPPHTTPPAHVSTNSQSHQPIATIRLVVDVDGEGELVQKGGYIRRLAHVSEIS